MGLGQIFLTRIGPGWVNFLLLGLGRVSHFWFGFAKFPLKISNFLNFFTSSQKNLIGLGQKVPGSDKVGLASYLLWINSLLGTGLGPFLATLAKCCCTCEQAMLQETRPMIY